MDFFVLGLCSVVEHVIWSKLNASLGTVTHLWLRTNYLLLSLGQELCLMTAYLQEARDVIGRALNGKTGARSGESFPLGVRSLDFPNQQREFYSCCIPTALSLWSL